MRRRKHRRHNIFRTTLHHLSKLWKSVLNSLRNLFRSERHKHKRQSSINNTEEAYIDSNLSHNQSISSARSNSFLLGLEDMLDLETLTTREFIQQIEWQSENQEILMAKEEDLTLLDDLLINFPES